MRNRHFNTLVFAVLMLYHSTASAQDCTSLIITERSKIQATCNAITMSMLHDQEDRPYLYVANKEAGLKIYDVTDAGKPRLAAALPVKLFGSLHVMNLTQSGQYIYLAIGNHFNNKQPAGLAIVEVTNPEIPVLKSYWTLPGSNGGCGIVKVQDNFAYLGAMGNGLVILNISDKMNIRFISQFIPDTRFPDPKAKKSLFNARGMQVSGDLVYICYDAGGLRIINIKDKSNPVETGRYSNPVMNGKPRAYNNIVVDKDLAYIAVDYCGMEVLNIRDPSNIQLAGWWNPYGCPKNNWFTSPVHANEIAYDSNCRLLFLSTGKSDLNVVNVADPANPVSCREYGGARNKKGTWGVSVYKENIYLSYICAVIPFASNWTGIQLLTYAGCR